MTVETLVAEIVALFADDEAPDQRDLAVRHELPVETVRTTICNAVVAATFRTMPALYWCMVDNQLDPSHIRGPAPDRSPRSLALLLAHADERVRSDPAVNFEDGPVQAAVAVLRGRLDHCVPVAGGALIEGGHDVSPFPRPSTPPLPAAVDGAAALVACPDDPAGEGRDRPLGATVTSPWGPRTDEGGES